MHPMVNGACELLGIDPLYVANEGKFVAVVAPEEAEAGLAALRSHPLGAEAAEVGADRRRTRRNRGVANRVRRLAGSSTCSSATRCRGSAEAWRSQARRSRAQRVATRKERTKCVWESRAGSSRSPTRANCLAKVDVSGVQRTISVRLLEDDMPEPDDWVLVHVGFAMAKIDETEALLTLGGHQETRRRLHRPKWKPSTRRPSSDREGDAHEIR